MRNLKIVLATALLAILVSCSKKDDTTIPSYEYKANVYVAGGMDGKATVWKNGVATALTGGTSASCVFVSGTDVYVGGREKLASGAKAKYWKNGVVTDLSTSYYNSKTNSIFVSGNDVYACGYVQNFAGGQSACYWKNGTITLLSNPSGSSAEDSATGIYVAGNTVYVCGGESDANFYLLATIWKIGSSVEKTVLSTSGIDTYTTGVTLLGTNVCVSAYEVVNNRTKPVYFNNGTRNQLPFRAGTDGWAYCIAKNATNIFVGGYDTNNLASANAYFWKDGVANNLTSPTTAFDSKDHSWAPSGIAVLNGTVYQSAQNGYLGNFNAMFLDGSTPVYLTNSETIYSFANGIFVTPL